jgi:hypothetical protein
MEPIALHKEHFKNNMKVMNEANEDGEESKQAIPFASNQTIGIGSERA